jgi:hypothetical protein
VPADSAAPMFSVQVYPAMDHLWRYFVPVKLWKLFQPFGRTLRRRLLAVPGSPGGIALGDSVGTAQMRLIAVTYRGVTVLGDLWFFLICMLGLG